MDPDLYDRLSPRQRQEVYEREQQRRELGPVISQLAAHARAGDAPAEIPPPPRRTKVSDGLTGGLIGLLVGTLLAVAIIVLLHPSATVAFFIGQLCGATCTLTGVYLEKRRL